MENFLEETISSSTLKGLRRLEDSYDTFHIGMKQLLNFQFLLYDSVNDLAMKMSNIRSEMTQLSLQILNIDDSVSNYLRNNKITLYTRDGVPMDDAFANINDRVDKLVSIFSKNEEKIQAMEERFDAVPSTDEFQKQRQDTVEVKQMSTETTYALEKLRTEQKNQAESLNDRWTTMQNMFKTQIESFQITLDQKISEADLEPYMRHDQIAELMTFISKLPRSKSAKIPEIIPHIFQDTTTTFEEKVSKAFEVLCIEKSRLDLEDTQLVQELKQLKQLAVTNTGYANDAAYGDFVVRDISTDSGYSETFETYHQTLHRGVVHSSIAVQFDPPGKIDAVRELPIPEVIESVLSSRTGRFGGGGTSDEDEDSLYHRTLAACEDFIEKNIMSIVESLNMNLSKDDVSTLVKQLRILQNLQQEVESVKIKMQLKADQSIVMSALEQYMKREEFYEMMEANYGMTSRNRTIKLQPKIKSRGQAQTQLASARKPKPQLASPAHLVLAKNSKMLGINEKYLVGDDGKTYLKETSRIADKKYNEPAITGGRSKSSYFEKSKKNLELDGIDAVIDFQPFVPADEDSA